MSSAPGIEGNANRSIISGEFETREQSAPGFEIRVNNSSLVNDRRFDSYVNAQPPSYKHVRPGQNSSVASSTRELGTTEHGSGPGFDDIGRKNTSEPGLGSQTTSYNKAPGVSGQVRENQSKNNATNTTPAAPVNPQDYVGISLVGKKFKAVNPDAYYVEKNEN
ncbi:hypothetical protein CTI12_AA051780 [Artemisia annua]|uniref:Uncharacterized protein n=1 Tax=Artemisia annua TaxID=35608 RepID=A0A2U1Q6Y8_ARTAN|nr:hypothetical protein CTI12_AA051780 [Artemisia annua]